MKKRSFLQAAMAATVVGGGATAITGHAQNAPKASSGPTLLTVSGLIGAGNRGALDPALDQMMVKHHINFNRAQTFDFASLTTMPSVTIKPTLEYDNKQHVLRGPLLITVAKASGVRVTDKTSFLLRAVDGYVVVISAGEATKRGFIVATHLDGHPMALGGLGPLWTVYDADKFPDMAAKPVTERFGLCPWATYHIEVKES